MNDTGLRHAVAFVGALICVTVFFAGYISGGHGWWWVVFGCIIIYGGVYKIINVDAHPH